jgi:hypothetical protein
MKKIAIVFAVTALLTGCEDFLDTVNRTKKDTSNYPATSAEAYQVLTGVYAILGRPEPLGTSFMTSELMSDDRLGGGGDADLSCKAIDRFQKSSDDMFNNPWRAYYFGVFRSNYLISVLDNVKWSNNERDLVEGEVHYLRAHFYFDLSRMFGRVPLVLEPEYKNLPQAPAAETYALIASDLKTAIEKLPPVKFQDINRAADLGRANRWAAEALMARVFLFYTGYYQTEILPLQGGGEITRQQVIDWLNDCIENSGHGLVDDFRNLWPYSYRGKFEHTETAYDPNYKYAVSNDLNWEGDGNKETIFAIKFSTIGYNFDSPQQKSNQLNLYFGMRFQNDDFKLCFPFGIGWGMGTVNPNTWNEWDDADLRKKGSILNTNDRPGEIKAYRRGGNNQMDETLFYQKKYMPVNVWKDNGAGKRATLQNYSYELYTMGANTDIQSNNTQDLVLIRFADVLLMHAELTGGQTIARYGTDGMNVVRRRAKLADAPYSLDNLKRERRFELAFEGIRYYDILRWHDWDVLTLNQTNIPVYNMSVPGTRSIVFRPETGGFLPIPQTQIDLQEGILVQNPGWEGSANFLN